MKVEALPIEYQEMTHLAPIFQDSSTYCILKQVGLFLVHEFKFRNMHNKEFVFS